MSSMRRTIRIMLLQCTACTLGPDLILADECAQGPAFFCAAEGNWWDDTSWKCESDCSGPWLQNPNFGNEDSPVIKAGKICHVGTFSAGCKSITVEEGAVLHIEPDITFSLTYDYNAISASIRGTLLIEGTLYLANNDRNLQGNNTGRIIGQSGNAEIVLDDYVQSEPDGIVFSIQDLTLEGTLTIRSQGNENTFSNDGATIDANSSGSITINTEFIMDEQFYDDSVWKVSNSSLASLVLDPAEEGQLDLSGDFSVSAGLLDLRQDGLTTMGRLTHSGGTIQVATGAAATFSKSP